MSRESIHTSRAPQAIGPYSQAIRVGSTIWLSGQIALDPRTMALREDPFEDQVRQVLDNLSAVAEAAGGSLSDVVKLNVYLTNLDHFGIVNEVMAHYFEPPYPARAAVGVAALPKGAAVEMEAVMVCPD